MKKALVIFIALILINIVTACTTESSDNTNKHNNTTPPITTAPDNTEASISKDEYHNLKLFIEKYNSIAVNPITDYYEIDIQDDEYYRTEFRLNAYKDAPALKATLGTGTIEIINSNYNGILGSDLRIYATLNSLDATTDLFESYCKACDSKITQKDFDDFYKYYSLDSKDCRITIGDISGYVMNNNGCFDIMLDASPDYFE